MSKELDNELKEIFPNEEQLKELTNLPTIKEDAPVVVTEEKTAITPICVDTMINLTDDEIDQMAVEDFQFIRTELKKTIDSSKDVLAAAESFAVGTMDPELVNSYTGLLRSFTDNMYKLLELHNKLKNIKSKSTNKENKNSGGKNITNNTLIMTTEEIIKMIKKEVKK